MEFALAIAQLLNAAAPGIAEIILLVRRTNGTVAVIPLLDEADKQFAKNIERAAEYIKGLETK
jgi:hypothetical protein